jgi:hypothetical protein
MGLRVHTLDRECAKCIEISSAWHTPIAVDMPSASEERFQRACRLHLADDAATDGRAAPDSS